MNLSDVVAAFTESRADWDPLHAVSITSESSSSISIALNVEGRQFAISALYIMPDSYPSSGCLLTERSESSGSTDSKLQDKLAAVSEKLQDKAPFSVVLKRVCQALDVPLVEDELKAVECKLCTKRGAGNSMDEDEGSEEPMSEGCSDSGAADSGDDVDSDVGSYGGGSGDEADKDLLIECGQRQGRWKRYEEELVKMHTKQQQLSMEQGLASKRQIFSSEEGFQMLSNELLGFIKRQDFNVTADSAGDDLYTWNVSLWKSAFDPSCQLAKDLNEVSTKWAVSSIQLRFTFKRGLHPFYPPRLEVVQPHLSAPLPGALASHPLLQLRHWDPWLNMSQLLDKLREFLEVYGSVDVANPRNGDPVSAFSPVQVALARLEPIADVKPMCYSQFQELYDARNAQRRESTPGELPQQLKKQRIADTAAAGPSAAAAAPGLGSSADTGTAAASNADSASAAATSAASKQVVWAKGTGYGFGYGGKNVAGNGGTWDAKQATAAQEAQDQQLCELLQGLAHALEQELPGSCIGTGAAAAAAAASNGDSNQAATEQQEDQEMADVNPDDSVHASIGSGTSSLTPSQHDCLSAIGQSVLLPLLAKELGTVSFSEMTARHQYYQPLLAVLQTLCRPCAEHLLLMDVRTAEQQSIAAAAAASSSSSNTSNSSTTNSVAGAISGLVKSTTMYKDRMTKVLDNQQTLAAAAAAASTSGASGTSTSNAAKQQEVLLQEAQRSMQIADTLLQLNDRLQHLTRAEDVPQAADTQNTAAAAAAAPAAGQRGGRAQRRSTRAASKNAAAAAAAAAAAPTLPSNEAAGSSPTASSAVLSYEVALKGLVLDSAPLSRFHGFKGEADREPLSLKARVQRVTSEMAGIERLIVVSECSSIFVRVDDDNSFLWRALITGPEETPYSGGAFIFDMFFPPNYPTMPPKVLLRTTGNGTVRFNPNLYNCGKVCLSLLGTWSGGQGESWNPEVSSAFQVLVSIQSLILVPEPYFNEPGYEQRGDKQASKEYNKVVREATIKWAMIDQLQHPPAEFAAVIQAHFKMRGGFVLKQIQGWIDEARAEHTGAHASRLEQLKGDLEAELNKLT